MVQIRVREHRVLAEHEDRSNLPRTSSFHHLRDGQPDLLREALYSPRRLEFRPCLGRGDHLIAREDVRESAHVAGTLDVVLATQGVDSTARDAEVSRDQGYVGAGLDVVDAGRVLGDAHGIEDRAGLRAGEEACRLAELLGRNSRDLLHLLRAVLRHRRPEFLESLGPLGDVGLVLEALGQDDVHEAIQPCHIRPGKWLQVDVGDASDLGLTRIDHDDPGASFLGGHDVGRKDRVSLGGVTARDEEDLGIRTELRDGVRHRATSECGGQTGHRGRVSKTCAVVYIVGPSGGPPDLLQKIVLFVRAFRRGQVGDTVGSVLITGLYQARRHQTHRLFPGGRLQLPVLSNERSLESLWMRHMSADIPSFQTEATPADRVFTVRQDAHDLPVEHLEEHGAARTAVTAGGKHVLVVHGRLPIRRDAWDRRPA